MTSSEEKIVKIEALATGELQLILASGGEPDYQYVYREARGVYWDNDAGAFKGTERKEWSYADWFAHIVDVCSSIGVSLHLGTTVEWAGISDADKRSIMALSKN